MTTLSLTTAVAKEEFAELINRVIHTKEKVILTRRGKEVAALIPIEDLLLLETMLHKNDLQDAITALKATRSEGTITLEDLKLALGNLS